RSLSAPGARRHRFRTFSRRYGFLLQCQPRSTGHRTATFVEARILAVSVLPRRPERRGAGALQHGLPLFSESELEEPAAPRHAIDQISQPAGGGKTPADF